QKSDGNESVAIFEDSFPSLFVFVRSPGEAGRIRPTQPLRGRGYVNSTAARPGCRSHSDGEIGEEIPAHVSAGDGAAQLGVVAQREPHHARPVSVIGNPWSPLGNRKQGIEAERELAERAARLSRGFHL